MPARWSPAEDSTIVVTVRMSKSLSDRVDECTFIEERTRSDLLRQWITDGIERAEKSRAKEET